MFLGLQIRLQPMILAYLMSWCVHGLHGHDSHDSHWPHRPGEKLDFHGCLRLMRWIVDVNFASINSTLDQGREDWAAYEGWASTFVNTSMRPERFLLARSHSKTKITGVLTLQDSGPFGIIGTRALSALCIMVIFLEFDSAHSCHLFPDGKHVFALWLALFDAPWAWITSCDQWGFRNKSKSHKKPLLFVPIQHQWRQQKGPTI